jgi:hypothetical protein
MQPMLGLTPLLLQPDNRNNLKAGGHYEIT